MQSIDRSRKNNHGFLLTVAIEFLTDLLIDRFVFHAVSAVFQPYNGGFKRKTKQIGKKLLQITR